MADLNPYETPKTAPLPNSEDAEQVSSGRATYNIVSDTVVGANLRMKDNIFQAKVVGIGIVVGAIAGAIGNWFVTDPGIPWFVAPIGGAIVGMVLGLFGSGVYLMIYRGARHLQGKHD